MERIGGIITELPGFSFADPGCILAESSQDAARISEGKAWFFLALLSPNLNPPVGVFY
jgi:hypothetical protein